MANPETEAPTRARPTVVGHVIAASFGLVFVALNSSPLPGWARLVVCLAGGAAFVAVLAAFLSSVRSGRAGEPDDGARFTGRFWAVVAVEAVALFGGLAILRPWEPAAAVGWVALVVGLHFLPLSRLWPHGRTQLRSIGVAMSVLGVIGLVVAFAGHRESVVLLVSGVGSGLVLLGSTLASALETLSARS